MNISTRATTDESILHEWHYMTDVVHKSSVATKPVQHFIQKPNWPGCYRQNSKHLEDADPHAIYPTSIYRSCEGYVLAKPDASVIESCMSHTITTTIKIVNHVFDPDNNELRNVYQPLGR